jgi:hypothetical protein
VFISIATKAVPLKCRPCESMASRHTSRNG